MTAQARRYAGAESTLTAVLGRMAMDRCREITWDEMMRSQPARSRRVSCPQLTPDIRFDNLT